MEGRAKEGSFRETNATGRAGAPRSVVWDVVLEWRWGRCVAGWGCMKVKRPVGCWVVAAVTVAAVVFMIAGIIYGLVRLAEKGGEAKAVKMEEIEEGPMVIVGDASGDLPEGDPPPLSIREYLEFSHDRTLTTLATNAFEEAADGAFVDWTMRLIDVSETGGTLEAGMFFDYLLAPNEEAPDDARESMTLNVRVLLDPSSRGAMLKRSRGDKVRFQGNLRLGKGTELVVEDARVIVDDR